MIYGFKVFLDCQSFSSQGTVPIRDTPSRVSFHVSWRHWGSGYVFSVCDTPFWWKKTVSRTGNRGTACHFVRDTLFLLKYLVSRAEKGTEVMFSVCNTPSRTSFHVSWRHLGSGYVFLSAIPPFGGKNLYRELEIGGRHVILSAIHPFCRNTLCRVQKKGAVAIFPSTIHLFC